MAEIGAVRNREHATRVRDFRGLRFGRGGRISPGDIDALLEFRGKLYVFIEGKTRGGSLTDGQRRAYESLTDRCMQPPDAYAVTFVVDCMDGLGEDGNPIDLDYAAALVRTYRWRGKWRTPPEQTSLRKAVDFMLERLQIRL